MRYLHFEIFCVLVLSVLQFSCQKKDSPLIALSEEFPPLNYTYKDSVLGCSTEIVRELFKRTNIQGKISIIKWIDAYDEAKKRPNTVIFSIARTHEREKLFNWIGQITVAESNVFASKRNAGINIESYKDIARYKTSLIKGSYVSDFFRDKGIDINDEQYANSPIELVNKIMSGEAELIILNKLVFNYTVRNLGYYLSDFKEVLRIPELDKKYYVAISKNSDPDIVEKLQTAYKTLEKENFIESALSKYLNTN
ncbi:MAG: transporter substrate-binding domain-containing protein [Candidatus Delongbacteria bacterium]|jgi:polar amino acid transport system substrate-binding protein|nr:transporter substrate-binding domain-containing protein [Candidatus Delongbacteria bacterium]